MNQRLDVIGIERQGRDRGCSNPLLGLSGERVRQTQQVNGASANAAAVAMTSSREVNRRRIVLQLKPLVSLLDQTLGT